MEKSKLYVDRHFLHKEKVDNRLYSAFMEHTTNVIYNGIYSPDHPAADENGFRKDVIKLVKDIQLTAIRYPGGNYACSYDWEDTVGPVDERPVRAELAWQGIEPNTVGLAEFEKWTEAIGSELIMAINLSTRGVQDAANVVEYCNFPSGTKYSDLRRKHGHEKPYGIKTWCVGNEVDGPWQIARKKPEDYAWDAAEASKAMRRIDPDLELVAVGSSAPSVETYMEWDRKVLYDVYDYCNYISLHHYLGMDSPELEKDPDEYLASASVMERQIVDIIAACDYIKGLKKSSKTMYLSFDEYNVIPAESGVLSYTPESKWKIGAPELIVNFTMRNTLLFALSILVLMRHSDRVKIACQSILINGIGLVLCGKDTDAWVNASYYVMYHVSHYGRGRIMEQVYEGSTYETAGFGTVNSIDSVCVYHEDEKEIDIFAVNRTGKIIDFDVTIGGFAVLKIKEHIMLRGESLESQNSAEHPNTLAPVSLQDIRVDQNTVNCPLPGYSWNVLRISVE